MKYIITLPCVDEHEEPELFNELLRLSNAVSDDGELLYITSELKCPFHNVYFATVKDLENHLQTLGYNRQRHLDKAKRCHLEEQDF